MGLSPDKIKPDANKVKAELYTEVRAQPFINTREVRGRSPRKL